MPMNLKSRFIKNSSHCGFSDFALDTKDTKTMQIPNLLFPK